MINQANMTRVKKDMNCLVLLTHHQPTTVMIFDANEMKKSNEDEVQAGMYRKIFC